MMTRPVQHCRVDKLSLIDDSEPFDVTLLEAAKPRGIVLFSVGAGGNPERHLPLLGTLAEQAFAVVAPHFARLASSDSSRRSPAPPSEPFMKNGRKLPSSSAVSSPTRLAVALQSRS